MSERPRILLVDAHQSDAALAALLVARELTAATVVAAAEATALAEVLACGPVDLVVTAPRLEWTRLDRLLGVLARRCPDCALVLFGHDDELAAALAPGLVVDAVLRKGSAGFLRLPALVGEVLARRGRCAAGDLRATAAQDAPTTNGGSASEAGGPRNQQEMRDIALVFSHDLKEPMQQITRLVRRAQADPGQGGAALLQQILDCANRAGGMLEGMLEYLSVASRDSSARPVDLNHCLEQALDNLRGAIGEAGAQVNTAHLPTVVGDEFLLLHLFENLVSNAVKFRGREAPRLDIGVEARDEGWLLSFRDNGIGIPQAHAERIFDMGQRLHTRDEYPGSGIGLALCRRIVERLGGRIWAESADGAGATFYILLPRAPGPVARLA